MKNAVLLDVAVVRTDVSEERIAFIIRVRRIGELVTTLTVTINRRALRRNTSFQKHFLSPSCSTYYLLGLLLGSEDYYGVCSSKTSDNFWKISLSEIFLYMTHLNNRNKVHSLRFEVFTAVTMKNAVFWDVTPCSFVTTDVSEELSASIIRVTRIGEL
jgi:hypothetical protein